LSNSINDLKDITAETAVISSLLNHPEFILHTDWLKPEYFTQKENGAIYWAINELYKKGITNIDELNLNNQLASNKAVSKLMTIHNLADVSKYMELAKYASRDTLEEYIEVCKTVLSLAYKRTLLKKTNELQRLCFASDSSVEDTDGKVHRILNALTEEYVITSEIKTIGEEADEILQKIIDKQTEEGFGLKSKFDIYSDYFNYETGELIVVASRMKSGKTAMILNEAIHKAKQGVATVVFDTELTDEMWYIRAIAHLSGVTVKRIKEGKWSNVEKNKILTANEELKSLPLVHKYMPIVDTAKVFAICKILKYKMGLQFVCFDYIKGNDTDAFALSNRLGMITDTLKNEIAGELGMYALAACQLSRSNEISSSDKIAMYASTIIYWRYKTASEIQSDGGLDYGNIYTRIFINRNGAQQDEGEWMNLNYIGDTQTIIDCKQNIKEEPFGG
jgi:replicative DNA helicase